jgi:hypothetical protein
MGDKAYENIHVVASILKMYLRLLPIPLITFDVHPLVLQALGELFIIIYLLSKCFNNYVGIVFL